MNNINNNYLKGYIGDRMESDKVIDTAHGEGLSTGAGSFDF